MTIPVAIAYSPKTQTSGATLIGATTIVIDNTVNEGIESFPVASVEAPGVAVLCTNEHFNSEDPSDYETVTYTERDVPTNELRGVTRGVEGTAREWPAGTWIASFTPASAWNEMRGEVVDLIGHTEETVTGIFNVKTGYGAKGDNSTDDTAAIQSAINAAVANGGGVVFFPTGNYIVSSTLTVNQSNVSLIGSGPGKSIIKTTSASADVIVIGDGVTVRSNNSIKQLQIASTVARTGGAGISTVWCQMIVVRDVFLIGMHTALLLNTTLGYFDRIEIKNLTATTGVGINILGDLHGQGSGQYLSNILIDNPSASKPAVGVKLSRTHATWMTDCDILHCINGLLIDPDAGHQVSWCFIKGVAVDQCSGIGIYLHCKTSTSVIKGITFEGCWSGSCGTHGVGLVAVSGAVLDCVRFIGHRSFSNGRNGFVVNDGTNISIDACDVSGNSTESSGVYSGIEFRVGVSGFAARNCRSGQMAGFSNTQDRGIIVQPGGSDDYIITNNDLRGNVTAGLYDGGTGTNKIIDNNLS